VRLVSRRPGLAKCERVSTLRSEPKLNRTSWAPPAIVRFGCVTLFVLAMAIELRSCVLRHAYDCRLLKPARQGERREHPIQRSSR